MNVLIIEDEQLAARRLESMVLAYDPAIKYWPSSNRLKIRWNGLNRMSILI